MLEMNIGEIEQTSGGLTLAEINNFLHFPPSAPIPPIHGGPVYAVPEIALP